jgi:hypothetical protein
MKLFELYSANVLTEVDLGALLTEGIENITEENMDEIIEMNVLSDEKLEEISKKLQSAEDEKKKRIAREYIEKAQRQPVETHTDDSGNFAGYRYSISEDIGSSNYHDAHVRLSTVEGSVYYGSLWHTYNGNTRSINFEVLDNGRIEFNRNIGRNYFNDVLQLTQKVVGWFEEQVSNEVKSESKNDIEVKELDVESAVMEAIA